MRTFSLRPLISIAMIASLFIAQFAYVPHLHVGSSSEESFEHDSRPHVHVGHSDENKHEHSHVHGHSHNDSAKCITKGKCKAPRPSIECTVDHDQDAVFLTESPVSLLARSASEVKQNQWTDFQPIWLFVCEFQTHPTGVCDCCHVPDKHRHCPIYLLTMSIRC